jgi:hypothetical protein
MFFDLKTSIPFGKYTKRKNYQFEKGRRRLRKKYENEQ